ALLGRLLGEDNPNLGAVDAFLSIRGVVHLKDQVGSCWNQPGLPRERAICDATGNVHSGHLIGASVDAVELSAIALWRPLLWRSPCIRFDIRLAGLGIRHESRTLGPRV